MLERLFHRRQEFDSAPDTAISLPHPNTKVLPPISSELTNGCRQASGLLTIDPLQFPKIDTDVSEHFTLFGRQTEA
jgi:hypothetical protein